MSPDERRAEILELIDLAELDVATLAFALNARTVAPLKDVLRRIRVLTLGGDV